MAKTTIPVEKETRDMVREAKGFDRTYDEVLQEKFSTDDD